MKDLTKEVSDSEKIIPFSKAYSMGLVPHGGIPPKVQEVLEDSLEDSKTLITELMGFLEDKNTPHVQTVVALTAVLGAGIDFAESEHKGAGCILYSIARRGLDVTVDGELEEEEEDLKEG